MGTFFEPLFKMDPDELFSYSTLKLVRIRDRRLGLLYYGFLLTIIFYIVFYTLLIEKKYLAEDTPAGSFRFSLKRPSSPRPLSELPYCLQTSPSVNEIPNLKCLYYDDHYVGFPTIEENALLASTRITKQNMSLLCDFSEPSCTTHPESDAFNSYVADIEHFTLAIDHDIYATSLGIQTNGKEIKGRLLDIHGKEMSLPPPNQVSDKDTLDIIELGALLQASGTESLDILNENGLGESLRASGLVLLVLIDYTNKISFDTSQFEYSISVRRIKGSEFKAEEQHYLEYPVRQTLFKRHGLRLIFLRRGMVGVFDFQTMLINIIAGFALLSVATTIVDLLARFMLPEKQIYNAYMIQTTADFSDLRDNRELLAKFAEGKIPPEILLNPQAKVVLNSLQEAQEKKEK